MSRYDGGSEFHFDIRLSSTIKKLIIANVAFFLLQHIFLILFGPHPMYPPALGVDYLSAYMGLDPRLVLNGLIWQPVTYMFLHGDLFHLLINMLMLWMFGSSVEEVWGSKEFLKYYFITGVGAGLISLLTSIVAGLPGITIGASGAIFGLLVAFGMLFPDRILLIFFLFPMRARNAVILFAAIELWVTLGAGPRANGIARFAHIGGMLVGFLYLKYWDRVKYSIPRIRFNARPSQAGKMEEWTDFMNEEVDPILDKISQEGIHSLTRKERQILKKARGRRKGGL